MSENNENLVSENEITPVVAEVTDYEDLNNITPVDVVDVEEEVELTDEEKAALEREEYIRLLKESHIRFRPVKHDGKVTTNQFGAAYKEKRRKKNKQTKKSRRANRK